MPKMGRVKSENHWVQIGAVSHAIDRRWQLRGAISSTQSWRLQKPLERKSFGDSRNHCWIRFSKTFTFSKSDILLSACTNMTVLMEMVQTTFSSKAFSERYALTSSVVQISLRVPKLFQPNLFILLSKHQKPPYFDNQSLNMNDDSFRALHRDCPVLPNLNPLSSRFDGTRDGQRRGRSRDRRPGRQTYH